MAVLVTGGAGYIGSHAVKALLDAGNDVLVYDNLSTGFAEAVQPWGGKRPEFVQGDLCDSELLSSLLKRYEIQSVMHFAAFSRVGESMLDPAKYYTNNVVGTLSLLETLREADVRTLIFSSTAAVYGEPESLPIGEDAEKRPTSVYGRSKWMLEQMLRDYDMAYGLRSISLRYFNAAGADASGDIGEAHDPETHLIPNLLRTALGLQSSFELYGTDYATEDGTCVRDYIHVTDLVDAHVLALNALRAGAETTAYNLGIGHGYSNRQVLDSVERVTGKRLPVQELPRRPGDPAMLIASGERMMWELGWQPRHTALDDIVRSAWNWIQRHPKGYR